jgi:adenosine kinase
VQVFALNFSAPFIPQFFGTQLQQIIPYCDILIMNEAEAESWAAANGQPAPKDMPAVAKAIAMLPKSNASRPRIVVITQGAESTVLVSSAAPDAPKVYAVHPLKEAEIVDTNGAGDAFAGGFLGAWVAGKNVDECVEAGHKMGSMCVQQVCFPWFWWMRIDGVDAGRPAIQVAQGRSSLNSQVYEGRRPTSWMARRPRTE